MPASSVASDAAIAICFAPGEDCVVFAERAIDNVEREIPFGAYGLTLAALQLSAASAVSAVRETSVVIAVALASRVLHEAVGYARMGGAVVVTAGVAAVALG